MKTAHKLIALSILSAKQGSFDEAGVLFAQALSSDGIDEVVDALKGDEASEVYDFGVPEDDNVSESSETPTRRTRRSVRHIGAMLSASMEVVSSEEDEDDEEETPTPDPDLPGEELVPASFSSDVELVSVTKSSVKLRG